MGMEYKGREKGIGKRHDFLPRYSSSTWQNSREKKKEILEMTTGESQGQRGVFD